MLRRTCGLRNAVRPLLQFANLHGFELRQTRPIAELNLVAYAFVHTATGAAYYHVDCDDSNNHFCIGFRTPAQNDKGTSHVLEHTTLCGSRRYPVRDPFFLMMRRSLSSFMNAMTGADYTLYPFSTVNPQDFRNLMSVYLDAVFCPLLRREDFEQEGHRVELASSSGGGGGDGDDDDSNSAATSTPLPARHDADNAGDVAASRCGEGDKDARDAAACAETPCATSATATTRPRLVHNGVVYNEMRGVVSDPSHHFARALLRTMLPETHYTYESGGDPRALLTLTYDELVQFHATHYHPSNSVTFTYGNQHPSTHMQALDAYFATFARADAVVVPTLAESARLSAPQVVYLDGPLDVLGNATRQKRVAVAYATPASHNALADVIAYSVLDTLLSHGPSSPMYRALIESQLGSEYTPMHGYASYLSTPLIAYGVAGVDEGHIDVEAHVRAAVTSALQRVCTDGFDARRVRAVVFQEELQQRHRAADYGLHVCTGLCSTALCRAADDPLDSLNWLPHLRAIAADGGATLLRYVREGLLSNAHSAVVSVAARADYLPRMQAELQRCEQERNATASDAEVAAVARASHAARQRVRATQDASVLPSLTVADIPAKAFAEPAPRRCGRGGVEGNNVGNCNDRKGGNNNTNNDNDNTNGNNGNNDDDDSTSTAHACKAAAARPGDSSRTDTVTPCVYTLTHPTNGLVYVHGLVPFARTLADAIASSDCIDDVPAHMPLVCALLARTGAGAHTYKKQSVEHELVCNRFAFAPMVNESYAHAQHAIAGVYCNFFTTTTQLAAALALLRVTLLEPRTRDDDDDVRSRVCSLAKTHCSHAIQAIQARGHRMATNCAVAKLTRRGALQERWYGLAHARVASQLLDHLQSSDTHVRDAATTHVLSDYRSVTQSLVTCMSASTWWATCDATDCATVSQLLSDFANDVAGAAAATTTRNVNSTRLTLASSVPQPTSSSSSSPTMSATAAAAAAHTSTAPTFVTEQLPIETSFVAFARRNELSWHDKAQAALRVACVLLANEYLHRRVREEGGAYGSSAHATLLDAVGGVTMSSYRDPQPQATAATFMQASEWLSDASNVTQARLDEAKLRLMATVDAPYAADSYGTSYFLHDVTQTLRQDMRDRMLAVTTADVVAVAPLFAPTSDTVIATLSPASAAATQGKA